MLIVQQQLAMLQKISTDSLMMGFDLSNVNAIDDMFIQHVQNCAIHMNLADGMQALGAVLQSIGFECWDHDLVSNTAVVVFMTTILGKIVLINEHLALVSKVLQIDNDWCR